MKAILSFSAVILLFVAVQAQAPQKISYQAVVRNASGKLIQSAPVGIRITVIQGSSSGTAVYSETHQATTNVNGLVSIEIGTGSSVGNFSAINWGTGPYYLKSETDPAGGTNYTVSGISQLLSVPYALNAQTVGINGFTGSYNELTDKPVIDGSETRVTAGAHVTVTGLGTQASPYVVSTTTNASTGDPIILTTSQTWTVPPAVSKIKVELWGGAGGGGGAGAYSYSYYLLNGGTGGSGGYSKQIYDVTENQQFSVVVGQGGYAGTNAYLSGINWYGDTDGGNGGDSWFGAMKAAGGTAGRKGSTYINTINGTAGTNNLGQITGYASNPQSAFLDTWFGLLRSYLPDRTLTSKPGKGGSIEGYSYVSIPPVPGEGGCAVITFLE